MTAIELCFSSRVITSLLENPCLREIVPPSVVHVMKLEAPKGLKKFFPTNTDVSSAKCIPFERKDSSEIPLQEWRSPSPPSCHCPLLFMSLFLCCARCHWGLLGGTVLADTLLSSLREHPPTWPAQGSQKCSRAQKCSWGYTQEVAATGQPPATSGCHQGWG